MNSQPLSATAYRGASSVHERAVPAVIFVLLCYFMIDYFGRLPARLPVYPNFRPTLLLVAAITLSLFSQADKVKDRFSEPVLRIIVVLLLYVLLSLPLVEWPGSVIRENIQDFVKAVVFLFFVAIIADTDRRLKTVVYLFVGLQAFRILEPLFLYWTTGVLGGSTYVGGEFAGRLNGAPADVINANGLGFVIVTTLGFMHFLMLRSPSRLVRWAYYVLLPTFLYALVLTSSRGAFITFLVLLFFMFRDARRKVLFAAVVLLGAVVAWGQMSDFQQDRYLSLISEDTQNSGTVEGRFEGMKTELLLGLQRPIVGHGVGTTAEAKVNKLGARSQAAHNFYAELLIEVGVIGFIIFMTYIVRLYRLVRRNLARLREAMESGAEIDSFKYRLNKALLAVFWIYAVYSINYYGLSQEYWYLYGGICVAFARSLARDFSQVGDGLRVRDTRDFRSRWPAAPRARNDL